jgi:hypothetical protein
MKSVTVTFKELNVHDYDGSLRVTVTDFICR